MKTNTIKQVIAAIIGATVVILIPNLFIKSPSIDEELMKIVKEVNEHCPITIDSETILNNTMTFPEKTIQYNYTLVNMQKEDIDIELFVSGMENMLINNTKENPDVKYFRDKKVTINYSYSDKEGKPIHKFIITPDLYK